MKPVVALSIEEAVLVSKVLKSKDDKEIVELRESINSRISTALGTIKKD